MCNYELFSSPLAEGVLAMCTPFSNYSVAQARVGFQDTHLFRYYFGKPTILFLLVPYFMLPSQVAVNANKPSKPVQTPQDSSLLFSL